MDLIPTHEEMQYFIFLFLRSSLLERGKSQRWLPPPNGEIEEHNLTSLLRGKSRRLLSRLNGEIEERNLTLDSQVLSAHTPICGIQREAKKEYDLFL